MSLIPSMGVDGAQIPGVTAEIYNPDQLIAGRFPLVTDSVTVTGAALLKRGSVLGQVTIGAAGAAVAGANTGNGTAGAVTVAANAQVGTYVLTATAATVFQVVAPDGRRLADLKTGIAYADEIGLTLTAGGTAFVAGDSFTVAIGAGLGGFKLATSAATDGSQYPAAILVDTADASGGDVTGGIYIAGEFNVNALTFGAGITAAAAKTALAARGIYLKNAVSAADPS